MTRRLSNLGLLLRNLRYFRAANIAIIAGMAVATAALTGALLVGDSVRGSLRELAIQRLGPIDFALIAPNFFEQSLAGRLEGSLEVAPAIVVRGGALDVSGGHRTGGVQIGAIGGSWLPVAAGDCVVNEELARTLGIDAPDASVLLNLPAPGDLPRDAALARRSLDEITSRPQLRVKRIAAEPGLASMFTLEGGQRLPRNVWMNLADLQREIRQPGRVNLLLAKSNATVAQLNETLRRAIRLEDYGLTLKPADSSRESVLGSRTTYIAPAVNNAAERAAQRLGVPLRRVLVQLINNVVGRDGASIHYAVAAGLSALPDGTLGPDEVALNEWAAQRLNAKVGDQIRLGYYQRRPDGELEEIRADVLFRLTRILPMTDLGADRTLTPDYPGLTDKASIREAPPELGIRDELLNDDDETYWKQYRAAPKVFLNLETAQRLWGSSYGKLTSIRFPADRAADFERELLNELDPAAMGMSFRGIRAEQLAAASGSTDFSMLFIGLSFFLIASAALLAAMLFRLSVESRARQLGVLEAMGFSPRTIGRLALAEGSLLALVGGALGVPCAIAYTTLIVTGLRTWWIDAVGTTALQLHIEPMTLVIGFVSGLVIAMLAVAWSTRGLRQVAPVRLLSGGWSVADVSHKRKPRIAAGLFFAGLIAGAGMLLSSGMGFLSGQAAFFGGGALLLLASLSGFAWWLRCGVRTGRLRVASEPAGPPADPRVSMSIRSLAQRNASVHPARSLLTVSLIALASFLLVTVSSMRQDPPKNPGLKDSGTGAFRLILQADIPLLADLGTRQGRERLGMREPDSPIWSSARFTSLRRWAGQDASCLNLTRPDSPTILGVPHDLIVQNRFKFARSVSPVENPWTLLEQPIKGSDDIPIIADDETARYIIKLNLGQTISIRDQNGQPHRLRLVATLASSIFQSELLMSDANFRRLFPFTSGFGVVLVDVADAHANEILRLLGQELDSFAVTVDRTADRLAAYKQVANTYLSTFQTLGSLGLLLGTVGLAVVLLRGLIERKSELAFLSAIGFSPARRLKLVLGENMALLVVGMMIGALCALVAVLPARQSIHVIGLSGALAGVLLTGLLVLGLSAWLGGRKITPADLRSE